MRTLASWIVCGIFLAAQAHAELKTTHHDETWCDAEDPDYPTLYLNHFDLLEDAKSSKTINAQILKFVHHGQSHGKAGSHTICDEAYSKHKAYYKWETTAQIEEVQGNVLWLGVRTKTEGGNHPAETITSYFFSSSTGAQYSLNDLFTSSGVNALDQLVRDGLDSYFRQSPVSDNCKATDFKGLRNAGAIRFVGPELIVSFSDYDLGAYVCGRPEIRIGMAKVRPLFAPQGPLAK